MNQNLYRLLALSIVISVLPAGPVLADTEGGAVLEEVIVTAQRRADVLERTPVSMTAFNTEELANRAIVSEMDLQNVAGITVKAGQNGNQLNYAIRGQTIDSFTSSRPSVLPYINEVQIGLASSSVFYDLESIQILKGPQGTLFGRNSTGGAVLFTTRKPGEEFGGYATAWGGNYGEIKAEGAVDVPISDDDTALLRLSGFYQENDGWQDNLFTGETLGGVERKSVRVSLTLNPTDRISNDLVATYYDADGTNVSAVAINSYTPANDVAFVPASILYSPLMDVAFGFDGAWDLFLAEHPGVNPEGLVAAVAELQAGDFHDARSDAPSFLHEAENLLISNITTIQLTDHLELRNIIGYNDMDQNNAGEFDGTHFPVDDLSTVGRRNQLTQFSEEIQLQGTTENGGLEYVAGIYYSDEEDEQRSLSVLFDFEPIAPAFGQVNSGVTTNETIAVYAQGTYDLSALTGIEGLGFTLGGRYSEEDIKFDRNDEDFFIEFPGPPGAYVDPLEDSYYQTSWTVGLEWQVTDSTLIYGVSRHSLRSGGFNFYAPPVVGSGNEADASFLEEAATDVELGVKYLGALGEMPFRLSAAAYKMVVDDIQRANYVAIFGSLAGITVNVPEAEITGLDLETVLAPTDWLTLGASLSLADPEFTENVVTVLDNPDTEFGPYPDTPEWSASLYADMQFRLNDRFSLSLFGDVYSQDKTYFSSTDATLNPGSEIDSYTVANFRVALVNEASRWSVAAHVRNAFDEEYYVGGVGFKSLFATNIAVPAAPRTWMLEARFEFGE